MRKRSTLSLRTICNVVLFILIQTLFALAASSASAQFLYVHEDAFPGNRMFGFSVAPNGSLTPVPGSPFPTGGSGNLNFDIGSVNVVASRNYLYSTNSGSNTVSGFSINPDGSITPIPGSPFALSPGGFPVGVVGSPDGQFLFVGRFIFSSNGIDVFNIAANGSLTLVPGSPFGNTPNGIGFDVIFDPTRNHVITDLNSNQVGVLAVGPSGALTEIPGSPFTTPTTNNHKLGLTPNGKLLFVAGGGDPRVSIMNVAPDGSLSNAAGSPLSVGFTVIGTVVHPSGNFVYFGAGFDQGNNIRGFNIGAGGALTPIAGEPFASGDTGPSGLITDKAGSFLFAVNTFSASVGSFSIGANGGLTAVTGSPFPFAANGNPTGIVFVQLGSGAFDVCLQDDSNGTLLQFNTSTGNYQFTRSDGFILTGTGSLTIKGSVITLQHYASDRRVLAKIDQSANRGTASVQVFSLGTTFTIIDKNTANNSCS